MSRLGHPPQGQVTAWTRSCRGTASSVRDELTGPPATEASDSMDAELLRDDRLKAAAAASEAGGDVELLGGSSAAAGDRARHRS